MQTVKLTTKPTIRSVKKQPIRKSQLKPMSLLDLLRRIDADSTKAAFFLEAHGLHELAYRMDAGADQINDIRVELEEIRENALLDLHLVTDSAVAVRMAHG